MKKINFLLTLCFITSFYNANSMMLSPSSATIQLSRIFANGSKFLLKKYRLSGHDILRAYPKIPAIL
ncbi:MAG: hypothetical protein ACD_82C00198G0003, partial [uncultured bacterium]|jgi:hypothetical protein